MSDSGNERIKAVKEEIKKLINAQSDISLLPRQKGHGVGEKYKEYHWIDVKLNGADNLIASILFFEDFKIDIKTGNLHPGRNGYVVFQRWNNQYVARKAPNIKFHLQDCTGIFIPVDKKHRLETNIDVLKDDELDKISKKIFDAFLEFIKKGNDIKI